VKSKLIIAALFLAASTFVLPSLARAQEGEPVVVDEVIAQVGEGIITLSQLKREMKERIQTLVQNGRTPQQAATEVEQHKAELIAILVNEQLLLQKGKELEFTQGVEDEVNKRMLQVAKENGINSMDKLCEAMKQTGLSCDEARQTMRIEIMKQAVLESEVDRKIFYNLTSVELHDYFDKHKDKFLKPESVDLSEIFLSLAGKQEAEVKARADSLVTQARGGADFCTLAAAYSDRPGNNGQKPCKVGLFQLPDLRPDIAGAIKNLKAGGIPMREKYVGDILHYKMFLFHGKNMLEFSKANYAPSEFVPEVPNSNFSDEAIFFTDDNNLTNSFRRRFDDLRLDRPAREWVRAGEDDFQRALRECRGASIRRDAERAMAAQPGLHDRLPKRAGDPGARRARPESHAGQVRKRRRDRVRPAELSVGYQIETGLGLLAQDACQLGVAVAARIAAVVGDRDPHAATIVCTRRQRQPARALTKRCTGRSGRETGSVDRSRRCGRCAQRGRVGRAAAMPARC
jgi:parvulin-like peptidyl-prolyl isomerase